MAILHHRHPPNRYELLSCAWNGHALVGEDVAEVTDADDLFVVARSGKRWYRCLRCDAWIAGPQPVSPIHQRMPGHDEIDLPLRGPLLRDRYVLRLIACERALHVLVFGTLAVVLVVFGEHHRTLQNDYAQLMNDLSGGDPASVQLRGVLGHVRSVFRYSPTHLYELAFALGAYAALEAVEMVGLWMAKRWAEYLTLLATTLFVPLEVVEMASGVSAWKLITLAVNVAVIAYLLVAKRLFGIRGGSREEERKRADAGWKAIQGSGSGSCSTE